MEDRQTPSFSDKLKLKSVAATLFLYNGSLEFFRRILFRAPENPKNILIFKVGNIGDVTAVIPSFIAIRRTYPDAKITLLTSPGARGGVGAENFISGAWYLDSLKNYYSEDIAGWNQREKLLGDLRAKNFDLFIQIPDDWANYRTMVRNMVFAKLIGVRSATGFRVRTILPLFRKTQIDFTIRETETEFQLKLLSVSGIKTDKIEFDFPLSEKMEKETRQFIADNLGEGTIVGICPGGKDEAKQWPVERFGEAAKYLLGRGTKIIIFGGGAADRKSAGEIMKICGNPDAIFDATAVFSIHQQIAALKQCRFLLTNDTGPMHLAVGAGIKVVALFSIRNILGTWFPYGEGHKILYRRNLSCNYADQSCIKKSLEEIPVQEVAAACEELLK